MSEFSAFRNRLAAYGSLEWKLVVQHPPKVLFWLFKMFDQVVIRIWIERNLTPLVEVAWPGDIGRSS